MNLHSADRNKEYYLLSWTNYACSFKKLGFTEGHSFLNILYIRLKTVLETLPHSRGSLRYFPRLLTILIGEILVKLSLLLLVTVGEHKAIDF